MLASVGLIDRMADRTAGIIAGPLPCGQPMLPHIGYDLHAISNKSCRKRLRQSTRQPTPDLSGAVCSLSPGCLRAGALLDRLMDFT